MIDVIYHPAVQSDIRDICQYYDERSDTAADRFFDEFEEVVATIRKHPSRGFLIDENVRKILFKKFPYSLTYEVTSDYLYVFIVKHQKRHPSLGMKRRRLSNR